MDILDISGGFLLFCKPWEVFLLFSSFFWGDVSVSFKDFKRNYCQFGDLELF